MKNGKPDALVVLAVLFAAGILLSAISHSGGESHHDPAGGYASQVMPSTNR